MSGRKVSNVNVKQFNRNQVYRYVNSVQSASKPEIASELGMSVPTVLQIIKELNEDGYVEEVGEFASTGGRKATAYSVVKNLKYALGLDITKNHISFVLTDLSGDMLEHQRVACVFADEADYYKDIASRTEVFIDQCAISRDKLLGVGISIPGIVDVQSNCVQSSYVLNVDDLSLSKFNQYLPYECLFVNDANAAAIAEVYKASFDEGLVYLSLSNSVGGAIINPKPKGYSMGHIEEILYMGNNDRAGEIGHMTLYPGKGHCYCGKEGCADIYLNATILADKTQGRLETFFDEMDKEDSFKALFASYVNDLAIVINNLRMIFDGQIIVGGYVGSHMEPHMAQLRKVLKCRNTFEENSAYVQPCQYKIEASALGAALLKIDGFVSYV